MSEKLESACDEIANAIDDANGEMASEQIDVLITEALGALEHSVDEFNEMFGNLYQCTPYVYARNSADDADWITRAADIPEIDAEFDVLDEVEIDVETENELY